MDRTVLLTGCSSGVGKATAEAFLEADWTVYATAADETDLAELDEAGCRTATLDVRKPGDSSSVVERVIEETGRIDCLVNAASYAQLGPIEDLTPREVHEQFDVNVYGPHRLIRAVLPHMRAANQGTIVNVSSLAGRLTMPGNGAFAGSKSALEAMTDALRSEVNRFGIDVVLVEPSPVRLASGERREVVREPGEQTSAYDDIYSLYDDVRTLRWMGSVSTDAVASSIVEAATEANPDARYTVGRAAKVATLLRLVPDRWRDSLYNVIRWLA